MRKISAYLIITLFIGVVCLPALIVIVGSNFEPLFQAEDPPQKLFQEQPTQPGELTIQVWHHQEKQIREMPLEEYVAGVVAAEMPASFEPEALKAQAVIARTYALGQTLTSGGRGCDNHPSADICTSDQHCQAWISREDVEEKWSEQKREEYWGKIVSAVQGTQGMVVTYHGEPVDAVFHSTCGGHTDNSEEVWSASAPYLKGVECSYCQHSPWAQKETIYSLNEFSELMSHFPKASPVSAYSTPTFLSVNRSSTERLMTLQVNDLTLTGHELRNLLSLPSTRVSWKVEQNKIVFTTKGFGHGVGLCQYGADGMAKEGYDYREILKHYYQGVDVIPIKSPAG
ncbi:stage II sporulation protein D [Candidatus Contubernalis alkaliaceticus]|uniref:stage II sporulation protein D n=1 Tax=Candidatus Contubernalis alkaliaceticus TaxID=338645 RepID=UPI001F4C1718|nr:stage II sporulation protein D [Candidatus Contubernalis alkalaceticus]UNC93656.1 stage II sporulation protein D [Candidatus Contubernalis alkalaceticus]